MQMYMMTADKPVLTHGSGSCVS